MSLEKKLYFSAAASTGLILFGLIIFKKLSKNLNLIINNIQLIDIESKY